MSKRERPHKSDSRQEASNRPSTELDPKMLNIAAGGHFYERAKSRRNRHREVLLSGSGRVVTEEAVPLGSKRKLNGGMKEALARLRNETDIQRNADRTIQRQPALDATDKMPCAPDKKNKRSKSENRVKDAAAVKNIKLNSDGVGKNPTVASKTTNNCNRCTSTSQVIDLTD